MLGVKIEGEAMDSATTAVVMNEGEVSAVKGKSNEDASGVVEVKKMVHLNYDGVVSRMKGSSFILQFTEKKSVKMGVTFKMALR